jgi:hypothetical protein
MAMAAPHQRTTNSSPADVGLTRRTLLLSGAAGIASAVGVAASASPAAASDYSVIPRLPGEFKRTETKYSPHTAAPYESIDVSNGSDKARLFVPWTTPPSTQGITATWYYHSNMADRTALSSAYGYPAGLLVERGWVAICPDFGGSLWTSQAAIDHHARWVAWMASTFSVATAFSRANSGGGPLMCWAYGKNMIPNLRGMYLDNAAYDMTDLYARDPVRIRPVYGNSSATMEKTNPARLPASAWTGKRIRVTVSSQDTILSPAKHGMALVNKALPVAASATARWHDLGHKSPSWSSTDMIATFASWS